MTAITPPTVPAGSAVPDTAPMSRDAQASYRSEGHLVAFVTERHDTQDAAAPGDGSVRTAPGNPSDIYDAS